MREGEAFPLQIAEFAQAAVLANKNDTPVVRLTRSDGLEQHLRVGGVFSGNESLGRKPGELHIFLDDKTDEFAVAFRDDRLEEEAAMLL